MQPDPPGGGRIDLRNLRDPLTIRRIGRQNQPSRVACFKAGQDRQTRGRYDGPALEI